VVAALCVVAVPATAAAEDPIEIEALLDGRNVTGAGSSDPVVIDPATAQQMDLTLTNVSSEPVSVRRVRLEGAIAGLTVVAYDITTGLLIDGGATEELEIPVEFIGLEDQADGLLPGGLVLFDDDRDEVGHKDFVIDVKGDTTSVMGLFTIFVAIATAAGLALLAVRISRRTLIGNRFRRGVQFAAVGLGIGTTLLMGLAVLRFVAPSASVWVPLLLIPTAAMGVLGYLSPGRLDFELDEIDQALEASDPGTPEPMGVG